MSVQQFNLEMNRADDELVPRWCPYCGERFAAPHDAGYPDVFALFRAHRRTHFPWGPDVDDDDDPTLATNHYSGPNGEPAYLGALYDVTLSYTVEYRFRVAGQSKSAAKDRARDWALDATPADKFLVHTDMDEVAAYDESDTDIPDVLDPSVDGDGGD